MPHAPEPRETAPREITDPDTGIAWTCVPAFAGLDPAHAEAARVKNTDRYRVVCTPAGGARSVRLELAEGWDTAMPDEALLAAIREGLRDG